MGPVKILPQIQDWVVSEQLVVGWRENERNDVGSNLLLYGKVSCVIGDTEDSWQDVPPEHLRPAS